MDVDERASVAGRPWLGQYDAGVPATLAPYPATTLVDVVHDTATQRNPQRGLPQAVVEDRLRHWRPLRDAS